jgi:nitroimidazol reductase NimA-like FMN-containing flavoprotein (pyridoxamine 5'-phosphate oxidase superfamily)
MATNMTIDERDAFLSEVRIGVLSIPNDGRGPLTIPIWYQYTPGEDLRMTTGGASHKGKLLKKTARVSLCVQDEAPPYRYVSVEGPISIEDSDIDKNTRPLAHRYLGIEKGDEYIAAMRDFMQWPLWHVGVQHRIILTRAVTERDPNVA